MIREDGFYWVKQYGKWYPALWTTDEEYKSGGFWEVAGSDEVHGDAVWEVINETRLLPPS